MSDSSGQSMKANGEAGRGVPLSASAGDGKGGKGKQLAERDEGGGDPEGQLSSSQTIIVEASKRLSLSPTGVAIRRDFSISSPVTETDGEDSSVTVAVRVRPFSQREKRLGAKQVVRMRGNETVITSGEGVVHRFHYDHCFWSFDKTQSDFADQRTVYVSLARPLLDRSFEGYNTCLFAYGQTGSGKSYCIMGEGEEVGVVPQFCRELFDRVSGSPSNKETFKVQISYYEIYKEKIYDLLASTTTKNKTRLRVREHPVMGPYVEDLSTYVASSYKDIEHWISLGNRFRATAATGMNDRSSRSHSVFTIMLTQTSVLEGEEHSKVSRINLIDLAGSERSSVAMTSGDRLKEGASINRSLHTLGKVISLLSERSTGRRKKVYIPYRDSTLTWLLKESLGGNSKTAMIATISPADLHHDEALSTLRYAHQTRNIINVARVNEDPNARLIRDLREEIFMLRQTIGAPLDPSSSQQEIRELREKLRESEKLLTESTRTWQERLSETEMRKKEELERLRRAGTLKVDNKRPNLVNLNEDPQLSEMLLYILKDGVSMVGRAGSGSHDIQLTGALVAEDHCSLLYQSDSVVITPSEHPDAQTFINGSLIAKPTTLHHGDRVVFGGEHFFRFNHPLEVETVAGRGGGGGERGEHGFEFAKNELFRVQTEKLRAEQESRMREIQESMETQRREFESRLRDLGAQMEGQSMELSVVQQSREETEEKVEELARKNEQLEQETIKQRHLLHLERLKTEKETKDMAEKKTKLMTELEREKEKLERDIQQLTNNKKMREKANVSATQPQSLHGEGSLLKGAELVRLSMKLQEATIISKTLGKPWTFSKEETFSSDGKEEVSVRVSNTQLAQVTTWDLDKFETRLEQMRELYIAQSQAPPPSSETAESVVSTGSDDTDPFHDPDDVWVQDSLATPITSPQRRLTRPYSAASSRSSGTPSTNPLSVRRTLDLTSSVPRNHYELLSLSKTDTPVGANHLFSHHLSLSLPRLCHDRVSRILSSKSGSKVTVFQRALQCMVDMMTATRELEEAFTSHSPTHSLSIPFSETTEVRTNSLQLCSSLEQLLCHAHSLHTSCHMISHMTGGGRGPGLTGETCQQLMNSLTHQTALYCSRLFTSTDTELPGGTGATGDSSSTGGGGGGGGGGGLTESVQESCQNVRESLEHVAGLLGRLSLSWRVMEAELDEEDEEEEEEEMLRDGCWVVGEKVESFLKDQENQELSVAFYQGHGEWSQLQLENSCYSIQTSRSSLQSALHSQDEGLSELASSVAQLISLVTAFIQDLANMQSEIWRVDVGESINDVIPNRQSIINLLLHLQQVESSISTISSRTATLLSPPSPTTPSSHHLLLPTTQTLGATINKLAASAQALLRSSAADTAPEHSFKIQEHAKTTGRAVKSLSTLLKSELAPPPLSSHTHKVQSLPQQTTLPQDPYIEADDDYV